jgi:protein-S-isoprenylcysteine O-methyltransferase Ste14
MNLHAPQIVFLIGLATYLATRGVYQRRASGGRSEIQRSSVGDRVLVLLVVAGQVIVPLIYLFSPAIDVANYEAPKVLTWLGALAWIAGMWVFWRSHADLGKNWSVSLVLHSDHRLVTRGVYREVRHPMYSSFLLLGFAQALLLPNWVAGFGALVAVALMCVFRIPQEEAMMSEHFGQEYREYMQQTGRLTPRLVVGGRDA